MGCDDNILNIMTMQLIFLHPLSGESVCPGYKCEGNIQGIDDSLTWVAKNEYHSIYLKCIL